MFNTNESIKHSHNSDYNLLEQLAPALKGQEFQYLNVFWHHRSWLKKSFLFYCLNIFMQWETMYSYSGWDQASYPSNIYLLEFLLIFTLLLLI